MFSLLYLGLKLFAEKGAENKAQYKIDKKYREIAKMELWEGMEKQIYDNLKYDKFATAFPDKEQIVYWGGNRNKSHMMSLRTIRANKKYHSSGLTETEFLKEYFLEEYRLYTSNRPKSMHDMFDREIKLYKGEESYQWIRGRVSNKKRDEKYCPAIVVTKLGSIEPCLTIFLDEEKEKC